MQLERNVSGAHARAAGSKVARWLAAAGALFVAVLLAISSGDRGHASPTALTLPSAGHGEAPASPAGNPPGAMARPGAGGPAAGKQPSPRPAFDLGAVMRQVHFAFRARDGAWRGGHTTYDVVVQPDGVLEVKPWHHAGDPQAGGGAIEGTPVAFSPSILTRGGRAIAPGWTEAATNAAGQLEMPRGEVTERLVNGPEGVEQSWLLARRPGGKGDLEVRIAMAGGRFAGASETGLHFTNGALGVRYGRATWIDGLGVRVSVPAHWDGAAVVLRVPESVVESSAYPAVLDPVIGPEVGIDEPVTSPARAEQSFPAIAAGDGDYLVVWQDFRGDSKSDIYGARVKGSDATVLDPAGIAISTGPVEQSRPAVAWDGTHYFVVWQQARVNASFDLGIYGARVDPADGRVIDADGIAISANPNAEETEPAVAWDGTNYLVVWEDHRSGVDVFGARVRGADGTVLDPAGFPISQATGNQAEPAVAWDGTEYLVVWTDLRANGVLADIYGARVTPAATVQNTNGIAISTALNHQSSPALAWSGSNFLVVWGDTRFAATDGDDLYGARVTAAGTVLEPGGIAISRALSFQKEPTVAWDGTNFVVAWQDSRSGKGDIYGARVSAATGAVLDPAGIAVSTAGTDPIYPAGQFTPAVASNGSGSLVVWHDYRSGSTYDVYGTRLGTDGGVLDSAGFVVSTAANEEGSPAMVWDGANYFVAWWDKRSGDSGDIFGARVRGSDWTLLDPAGIPISTATKAQSSPAVSVGNANYLVVWTDGRRWPSASNGYDVYGARVRRSDGAALDPSGIAISSLSRDQQDPAVAWNGTDFLVVWSDRRAGLGMYDDIYGARVADATGAVLDSSGFVISGAADHQSAPAVAWDGRYCLVVWQDNRNSASMADIYGARVDGNNVLNSTGIAISAAGAGGVAPAVVWGGGNYLVVWQLSSDVYGALVRGTDGVRVAGFAVSTAANIQGQPAAAWDGTDYLVVWRDFRSATSWDIYGSLLAADGTVKDPAGFLVAGGPFTEQSPAVVSPGARHFLVVYEGYDARPLVEVQRLRARHVLLDTPPSAATQSVATPEDVPVQLVLSGADVDGDPLTYLVVSSPGHGTLGGSGANLTYTPAPDYAGSDSFTFVTNDGLVDSAEGTVTITVAPVNDAPIAQDAAFTVAEGESVGVTLVGSDVDGDPLTYLLVSSPVHGTLAGSGASLTYTPASGYDGPDVFTFKVNDGSVESGVATVSITVVPLDEPAQGDEPAKGGCGCGTTSEAAPLGALLLGLLRRRRTRVTK